MSDYIFGKIRVGDILTFRYVNPKKIGLNMPRDMITIAPNYNGFYHGIKLSGLTTTEQEFLQNVFRSMYGEPTRVFEALTETVNSRKRALDELNQRRNELLKQNQAVVMKPAADQQQGLDYNSLSSPLPGLKTIQDKFRRTLGSVIGKVSTFGRTQIVGQPRGAIDPQIQQQIAENDWALQYTKQQLDYYMSELNRSRALYENVPEVPADPYRFYHMFLKGFIGNNQRMKDIYRKFNIAQIQNPRIVKSVGVMPGG